MKEIVKSFLILCLLVLPFRAQGTDVRDEGWKERMMAEKIAFLTAEMDLTPKEAQVFWPLYNAAEKSRGEAFGAVRRAYKALNEAVQSGKTELEAVLKDYIDASARLGQIDTEYVEKYKKVLPMEKVAKLYLGEEKFRRQQIHKLGGPQGK